MSRVLLDTHALIWFLEGDRSLSSRAKTEIEDRRNEVWISSATAWEIAIKVSNGKLTLKLPYDKFFEEALVKNDMRLLDPTLQHYAELLSFPKHHGDPFDRLIVAQAKVENLTLISCDPKFPEYKVPLLW